jgi:two-component system sensor histidine kinase CpxA
MKIRLSIFSKILLWFFLNMVLLAFISIIFFQIQFHVPPDSLLAGSTPQKAGSLHRLLRHELASTPKHQWNKLLDRYGQEFKVDLLLLSPSGLKLTSRDIPVPKKVREKIQSLKQFHFGKHHGRPAGLGQKSGNHRGVSRFFRLRTQNPTRYWLGMPIPLITRQDNTIKPAILLAVTDSRLGSGLLYPDLLPLVGIALGIMALSGLWWLPMVNHLTRPIKSMTRATEEIARGHFDIRVNERRKDEIGRLGHSINTMSERLDDFIQGRKRFLGDVAHELCSPLARLKMGLGVLEHKIDPQQHAYLTDVAEEAENISELVNEILSFSKAEMTPDNINIGKVDLQTIVNKVLEREKINNTKLTMRIDDNFTVRGNSELLARALANLLRNSLRYGGDCGPVEISAQKRNNMALIKIADCGPGVPEKYLDRIFDPFFRLEPDRSRNSGGAGLGLAIVKTCIEACQGKVKAGNREAGGFVVVIELASG